MAVAISQELFAPVGREIELCYQSFGDPKDEPMLLVMGLSGPMTWWDPEFCERLAARGFYIVRFDNRDVGRSSRASGRVSRPMLVRAFTGGRVRAPYSLSDMAQDCFGLLDHLGLASAHIVGVSMGGMIVQTMAILDPARARSLTSIMSTTGKRTVGWQHPSLVSNLIGQRAGRAGYVASSIRTWKMIGSPTYSNTSEEIRERAEETFDRGVSAQGTMRQMVAILTAPDRAPRLRDLSLPALVIHGLADKMVHVTGGRATPAAIPGAELLLFDGMGHDLPEPLWDTFVDAIHRTAERVPR